MELILVQVCETNQAWQEYEMASHSDPEKTYIVRVPLPHVQPGEYICDCEGYKFRGKCRHQDEVLKCLWKASEGPEEQTERQEELRICPRCGRGTVSAMEYV